MFKNTNNTKKFIFVNIFSFLLFNYFLYSSESLNYSTIKKILMNLALFFLIRQIFLKQIFKQTINIFPNLGLEIRNHHLNKKISKSFFHFDDIEECLIFEHIGVVSVHYKIGVKIIGKKNFVDGINVN